MVVYVVYNSLDEPKYVGQTIRTAEERWREHVTSALRGDTRCAALYAAIRKYGPESFRFEEYRFSSLKELNVAEHKFIIKYDTMYPSGYNLRAGGDNSYLSETTKKKISKANKGRKQSKEHIENLRKSRVGRKLSDAHKNALTRSLKGRVVSDDTKEKISRAHTGKKLSESTRRKISEVQKGKVLSDEHKQKISDSLKGTIFTDERRQNISKAISGRNLPSHKEADDLKHITVIKSKFRVEIKKHQVNHHLGSYASVEDARTVRNWWLTEFHNCDKTPPTKEELTTFLQYSGILTYSQTIKKAP